MDGQPGHGPQVGRALPRRGPGGDGRPIQPTAPLIDPNPPRGRASHRAAAVALTPRPVQIGGQLGLSASTVHAVLTRCRVNRLSMIDRVTGEPLRRDEHPNPRFNDPRQASPSSPTSRRRRPPLRRTPEKSQERHRNRRAHRRARNPDQELPHDHPHRVRPHRDRRPLPRRPEIHTDERAETAIAALRRATTWLAEHGVVVELALSDNGSCYRSRAWALA